MRTVTVVYFQREVDSSWEAGVAIIESAGTRNILGILDMEGQVVEESWDCIRDELRGTFLLLTTEEIKSMTN